MFINIHVHRLDEQKHEIMSECKRLISILNLLLDRIYKEAEMKTALVTIQFSTSNFEVVENH